MLPTLDFSDCAQSIVLKHCLLSPFLHSSLDPRPRALVLLVHLLFRSIVQFQRRVWRRHLPALLESGALQ